MRNESDIMIPAMSDTEIHTTDAPEQGRPPSSLGGDVAVGILRSAAILERYYNQLVMRRGITIQQYDVLRILRSAPAEGLPTLVIRDRMIHEAPGITRLIDKLEQTGLAKRDRGSPDRRQVLCHIAPKGRALLEELDEAVRAADDAAVSKLTDDEQHQLVHLLTVVRKGSGSGGRS